MLLKFSRFAGSVCQRWASTEFMNVFGVKSSESNLVKTTDGEKQATIMHTKHVTIMYYKLCPLCLNLP